MINKELILSISQDLGLTHIGSNLSCLSVLEEIYAVKKPGDIVILSNGHAHLAHLAVWARPLTDRENITDIAIIDQIQTHGIHCDRAAGCDASAGSLGHGIGIGIGYALADRKRDVYIIVSDGSLMEGSEWEALRIANDLRLKNIHIYCNLNGHTAVADRNPRELAGDVVCVAPFLDIQPRYTKNGEGFEGVEGHYKKL